MSLLGDILHTLLEKRNRSKLPHRRNDLSITELTKELIGSPGETYSQKLAQDIIKSYEALAENEKIKFFQHLAHYMDIDPVSVRNALSDYEQDKSKKTYKVYMQAVEPARQELFRRINRVPGATKNLVQMRAELLSFSDADPSLQALDLDFQHLFYSWFNRGFLVLRRISWDSSAHILEKIIEYESVHAIDSWDDLRRRLEPDDRRCFAFFHPAIPDEPLIFVEVALTNGIPSSVKALLAEDRTSLNAEAANTSVFYSISNCQKGLTGISFGNSLIKQVAANLSTELENLKTFVTLSPIPGLNKWLKGKKITIKSNQHEPAKAMAAYYLLNAKGQDGLPYDPVSRFHLSNGASIYALHLDADLSDKGMAQSRGVMVNYLYDLKYVDNNHESFERNNIIHATSGVKSIANSISIKQ